MLQNFKAGETIKNKKPVTKTSKAVSPFAVFILFFASCTLSPPQAPRWDTSVTLPIINKRYSVQELIKEENDLYTDDNGLAHFVSEAKLEPFNVGDRLTVEAFNKSYETRLGVFKILNPGSVQTNLTLGALHPNAVNLAGQTAPIPAFAFSLQPLALPPYDNYVTVEIAGGNLTLDLRNNLPVPLGNPLRFEVRNGAQGAVLIAFDINETIQPGQAVRRTVSFAGKSFGNRLAFVLSGNSPGSSGNPVRNIDPNSRLQFTLAFSELTVSRANARIGEQTISDAGDAAAGDSLGIEFADIRNGILALSVQNNFSVGAWMIVTLPDFYRADNSVVIDSALIAAKGTVPKNFNLFGYTFRPQAAPFGRQKIRFRWRIRTTNNPLELVTLASSDFVKATFASGKIIFSQIRGGFNAKTISITPQKFKVDLPEGLDSLRLSEVALRVALRNGVNFPMRTNFQVAGVSNDGKTVQLLVRGALPPGAADGTPVESIMVLDKTNSNIVPFFNALPKSITVRGGVTFGEPNYVGLVRSTDLVGGALKFDASLVFSLPSQKVELDIEVLEIDKSTRDRIKDKLQDGKVTLQFNNHLPVGATIALDIAQKRANVFTAPDLRIGPFGILAPDIDPATGRVVQAKANTAEVRLTGKQLEIFQQAPLYTGVLIDFPDTRGQLVRLVAEDYVEINAVAEVSFAVSDGKSK